MSNKITAGNKDGSLQVGYPIQDIQQTIQIVPTSTGTTPGTGTTTTTPTNNNNNNNNNDGNK